MWWGKTHEDKENSGTYDFDKEYMEIFVRSDAKKSVFPKDELEQGRCNCNLEDHDVVADVLAQMRRVGGLFNPPVDAFWSACAGGQREIETPEVPRAPHGETPTSCTAWANDVIYTQLHPAPNKDKKRVMVHAPKLRC